MSLWSKSSISKSLITKSLISKSLIIKSLVSKSSISKSLINVSLINKNFISKIIFLKDDFYQSNAETLGYCNRWIKHDIICMDSHKFFTETLFRTNALPEIQTFDMRCPLE